MNMNRAITRLFMVAILIIAVLIAWTSRWTVFSAKSLDNNPRNKLGFYQSLKIKRGELLAGDGQVLAKSVPEGGGTWGRAYPFGSLFSQTVGYLIPRYVESAGLEKSRESQLRGQSTSFESIFGNFSTGRQVGDSVYTYLDPAAQKQAQTLLAGRVGSVVAIVPQTGAVKVMYSNPTYNDNDPDKDVTKSVCENDQSSCPSADKIGKELNLATQQGLPPGSTFKIVTTTAALNSGKYTPYSTIDGKSPLTVSGVPLHNDGDTSYGDVTLTDALTNSINTVYAQVGESLGSKTMEKYMRLFGFYRDPPLDLPGDEMVPSGEYDITQRRYLLPTSNLVDLGRMSIGQDKLTVTPLQMAMVASAVADDGTLMKPRLSYKAVNDDGQTVATWPAAVYHHVMKPGVAKELQSMMSDVVEEGTGQKANLEGLTAAGKTGTASTGVCTDDGTPNGLGGCTVGEPYDDAWFIGFAPADDPKIAVAVEVNDIPQGYGGTYAAPIAAQIMKTLLAEGQ